MPFSLGQGKTSYHPPFHGAREDGHHHIALIELQVHVIGRAVPEHGTRLRVKTQAIGPVIGTSLVILYLPRWRRIHEALDPDVKELSRA